MTAMLALLLAVQAQGRAVNQTAPAPPSSIRATHTAEGPVLDGRDDEAAWRTAETISQFQEARPKEGAEAKQKTELRVLYDARYLYVFVRAWDTAPDSIVKLLSRRDDQTASDQIIVMIDSYRDRRTGFEFVVNPAGVKSDYAIFNDGNEDSAWDGVWDVATHVDSLGWTAEYRIPFSQLRFAAGPSVTFGFSVWRTIQRHTSQVTWPLYRRSTTGFVSQFGELTGLEGLASPRRAEIAPYVVARNEPLRSAGGLERDQGFSIGGDLKYAVASNLTLNATVNPDFGQVEADPGVLNLSAFETFFSERRPFFVEGKGLFSVGLNCFVVVDCSTGEELFYSRRIGRSPQLAGQYGDASSPTSTRILGAAKLTGRLPGGLSVGVVDAVTDRVGASGGRTLEPTTNYAVVRGNQDFNGGAGSVGLMFTGVNRSLDASTEDFLHRSAQVGALDARRRLGRFEVSGSVAMSRVSGSAEAITATQLDPVHYFQRPDDGIDFDPTRTSLTGHSEEFRFAKVGGKHSRFETGYGRKSAGFEVNDLGFLQQADKVSWTNWFALQFNTPNRIYQRLNWNFNYWEYRTTSGLMTDRAFNSNVHSQFTNRWWLHLGGTIGNLGNVYCTNDCTRGGPALRVERYYAPWLGIQGDDRHAIVPGVFFNYLNTDGGRTHNLNINPTVTFKVSDRFSTSVGVNQNSRIDDSQWFGNFTDAADVTHYTFAQLKQKTVGMTLRMNYTFTPAASLQLYANPFLTKGTYTRVRELSDPRAGDYNDRFTPYADESVSANPGGFNFKQFRSNAVFRWEYRPGSTLFVVWSQGRQAFDPTQGRETFGGDLTALFNQRAEDTFLVKMSYWLNR
ncbi:MAG: DUF5916 domain-containing protein [Gemmatimonadales bacterium]